MSFVRAAFAFVLLTPVVGFIGGRYLVTSLLAQNPETAMAPIAANASPHHTPTAKPTTTPTSVPPTTAPSATPRPSPTATQASLTPTIVLIMSTPTVTPKAPTAVPTAAPRATSSSVRHHRRTVPTHHKTTPVHRKSVSVHRHKMVPTARPTRVPTAQPTAVPTPGIVVLARYWIGSTVAHPGSTIAVGYVIDNTTGRTQHLMLGASIKAGSSLSWLSSISDPSHDVVATVPPGISTHVRYFTLSSRLRQGAYDVAWGLRNADTGTRDALVSAHGVLQVHR